MTGETETEAMTEDAFLTISVVTHQVEHLLTASPYARFRIRAAQGARTWEVERRWSDVRALHTELWQKWSSQQDPEGRTLPAALSLSRSEFLHEDAFEPHLWVEGRSLLMPQESQVRNSILEKT